MYFRQVETALLKLKKLPLFNLLHLLFLFLTSLLGKCGHTVPSLHALLSYSIFSIWSTFLCCRSHFIFFFLIVSTTLQKKIVSL